MEIFLTVLDAERLEREVYVGIFDHRSFFSRVLARKRIAGDGEGTAMPSVDGGFGTSEDVGAIDNELGAEELGGAS